MLRRLAKCDKTLSKLEKKLKEVEGAAAGQGTALKNDGDAQGSQAQKQAEDKAEPQAEHPSPSPNPNPNPKPNPDQVRVLVAKDPLEARLLSILTACP